MQQRNCHSDGFTPEAVWLSKRRKTSVSQVAWNEGVRANRLHCLRRELDAGDRARPDLFGRGDTRHGKDAT